VATLLRCQEGFRFTELGSYSRMNSTKSPASGAGNVSKPRLMSQVGRVLEVVCGWRSVFLQSERWRYRYGSAYIAAAVT